MIKEWVRYENIEERRKGYYVTYNPVFTGQEFSLLSIHVYDADLIKKIKDIAELELKEWVARFPTPLMVMIKNMTDSTWTTREIAGEDYLLGYPIEGGIYTCWGNYPEGKESSIDLSKEYLSSIYSDLPFVTSEETKKKLHADAKGLKTLRIITILWLCVIPALIAYYGWSNPLVSLLAFIYSIYMATVKGLQIWGLRKKSPKEIGKEKEEILKNHHHHHCKINPEGFLKLRNENFKRESDERNKEKIERMRI